MILKNVQQAVLNRIRTNKKMNYNNMDLSCSMRENPPTLSGMTLRCSNHTLRSSNHIYVRNSRMNCSYTRINVSNSRMNVSNRRMNSTCAGLEESAGLGESSGLEESSGLAGLDSAVLENNSSNFVPGKMMIGIHWVTLEIKH